MERNKIILLGSNDKEDATFKLKYPIKKQMDKWDNVSMFEWNGQKVP